MKAWVAALLLANGITLAWWQGWLSPLLDPPGMSEREPLRLARQLRPEAIRILPPHIAGSSLSYGTGAATGAAAGPPASSAC